MLQKILAFEVEGATYTLVDSIFGDFLKFLLHLQMGFPNWPLKPTGPTLESPQKDTGSAAASSSYGSGYYGAPATSGYQTGADAYQTGTANQTNWYTYGYARENTKEAKSSGSVTNAYKTAATDTYGKGKCR